MCTLFLTIWNDVVQVEVTKYEELEEVYAEVKLKMLLWDSIDQWDAIVAEWMQVTNDSSSNVQFSCSGHLVLVCSWSRSATLSNVKPG